MICIILILAFRVASAFLYCSVSNWTEYSKRRFQIQNKRVDIRLIILLRVKEIFHMHTFIDAMCPFGLLIHEGKQLPERLKKIIIMKFIVPGGRNQRIVLLVMAKLFQTFGVDPLLVLLYTFEVFMRRLFQIEFNLVYIFYMKIWYIWIKDYQSNWNCQWIVFLQEIILIDKSSSKPLIT